MGLGLVLAIVGLVGLAIIIGQVRLVRMNSRSMESAGAARQGGSIDKGDLALVTKSLGGPLPRGALVVVDFASLGQRVRTIRRVAAVPGDRVPNSSGINGTTNVPDGYYYLEGDSTNALDSRQIGLVGANQISGRVAFVFK